MQDYASWWETTWGQVLEVEQYYNFSGLSSDSAVTVYAVYSSVSAFTDNSALFQNCRDIIEVKVPSGLTSVPQSCFEGCSGLTAVTLGNPRYVAAYAFRDCTSLVQVNFGQYSGNQTFTIYNAAFKNCSSLKTCIFPDTLSLRNEAFRSSGLEFVSLPAGTTGVGDLAFKGCSGLSTIICEATTAPGIAATTFAGVASGGTLVYPSGSDYSTWLSPQPEYLGFLGWNGVDPGARSYVEVTYDTSKGNGYMLPSWPSGTKMVGYVNPVQSDYSKMIDNSWFYGAKLVETGEYLNLNSGFYNGRSGIFHVRYYTHGPMNAAMSFMTCGRVVGVKIHDGGDGMCVQYINHSNAFYQTSLSCITLPEGFRRFAGSGIFEDCPLKCITIPASMSEPVDSVPNVMGNETFRDADYLTKIISKGMVAPQVASNTFTGLEPDGTLYYPAGADYTTWLNNIASCTTGWTWATYNPFEAQFCDCDCDDPSIPIIDSGSTIPPSGGSPYIYLSGSPYMSLDYSGSCKTLPVVPINCEYSSFTATIDYNPNLQAHSTASVTYEDGGIKFCLDGNPNSAYTQVAIVDLSLFDTSGNGYSYYCGLNQYGVDGSGETSGDTNARIYFPGIVRFVVGSGDTYRDAAYVEENCTLDHITWTKSVYDEMDFPISADVVGNVVRFSWPVNHYSDPRYAIINVTFHDTSGNTYPNNYIQIEQAAGDGDVPSGDTPDMLVVPSSSAVTSAAGVCYAEIVEQNCNFSACTVPSISGDLSMITDYRTIEDSGQHFFRVTYKQNSLGVTKSITFSLNLADTDNNNYHKTFTITQAPSGSTSPIPSGSTVDSGGTGQTVTYSGCPLVFDHSASTGTWHVLPTVTTGGTSDNWWFNYNVPANDTTSARTITYYYLRYSGASCDELVDTVSYTISQAAGSGSTPMKNITLTPTAFTVTSAATWAGVAIYPSGCVFSSFTITNHSGDGFVNNPTVTGDMMEFTFPANTGSLRTDTFTFQLFDTDGDSYNATVILTQAGKGSTPGDEPDPWSKPEDSGYTWYTDDNLLKILPATKTLSYDEVTGYWPVTAHSFNNVEVRASGDVVFTYELIPESDQSYNSHKFYAHTEDNLGVTQQVSTIKLVAYSGTSAYSASTVLMKNPASSGWITASPNPVNANSQESQVNVYLTLTSCQRNINKEITDNPTFDAASWVTVTRVNNTTLTFNFQANTGNQPRSTYYYAYGLDAGGNNVYCRIDITQEANSMGITIIPDRTSLGKEAGSFTARVESTESGNFSFTTSPWMSVTSYVPSTSKSGTLYIDYSENLSNWPRTGVITATQQLSASPYTLSASTQISQSNTADTGYIRITPSTISVSRAAGVVEAEVSYGGLATYPQIVDDGGNMSIVSYDLDSNLITVSYNANDTSLAKSRTFLVTGMSTNGNVISATFVINQGGTGLPVAPIWRDYVLDLPAPGQGFVNYSIDHDGTVVYTGRAYGMGQDNIHLFYNHLCKSFLSNHIDFTEGYQTIREWLGNFTITSPELGNITSVSFFEDYSYENRSMTNTMSLNNPITNEVVAGGLVPFSFFVTGASGNVSIYRGSSQITGLTISDNEQHRYFVEAEEGSTYTAIGARYKTVSACEARYSLYYVNSYGGVDVIPFKGKSFKKTDTITRLNYSRSFRNNTLEFENVNYMNEIKPAWELNTHYLVDSQSSKMHELVESTCVYLYDAEEQTYTPVVMTDKKLEYKTFYNQGRKFYTYTINVEESQSKERR